MKKMKIKKSLKLNKQVVTILNNHETSEIKGGITPITVKPCDWFLNKIDTVRAIDTVK